MHYVISDIHGCYSRYQAIVQQIDLKDADRLYILGDSVDKGQQPIAVLRDLMCRKNAAHLLGNHDFTAYYVWSNGDDPWGVAGELAEDEALSIESVGDWMEGDGKPTMADWATLNGKEQAELLTYIKKFPLYVSVTVNGEVYLLCHTVPEPENIPFRPERHRKSDFLMGEPDYSRIYDPTVTLITGHTPTTAASAAFAGMEVLTGGDGCIKRGNRHIALDCGAAYGGKLGCLCLETGQAFYA